jgi:hypothetical protein
VPFAAGQATLSLTTTRLDHLPEGKQRELAFVLETLREGPMCHRPPLDGMVAAITEFR